MEIRQFDIWIADLNPRMGTEAGKTRPVVVVQGDMLNRTGHPSTLICPITSKVQYNSDILRLRMDKGTAGLLKVCDILLDQIRAIDNQRLLKKIGTLPEQKGKTLLTNLKIILDQAS